MRQTIRRFIPRDPVLLIAWALGVVSLFFVPPDAGYLNYIDFRTLGILWTLMIIIQGWKQESVFDRIGDQLLHYIHDIRLLSITLVFLCFISSMLITNDVALITFVPFAILLLQNCDRTDLMIPVIVLQTIAANLGSMLTPIGNPQNLYLYGRSGMSMGRMLRLMGPYTAASAVLLFLCVLFLTRSGAALSQTAQQQTQTRQGSTNRNLLYLMLFILTILSVLRLLPWTIPALGTLIACLLTDRRILIKADYTLLLTFVGFFIFTGNMGRIPWIHDHLETLVSGRETGIAILTSQVISNVPAALLLSGFTDDYEALMVGVDLGGLGTLIASMASLISWKAYSATHEARRARYLLTFTVCNLLFLAILYLLYLLIQ